MELAEDYENFDGFDSLESNNFYENRDKLISKMLQDSLDLVVSALNFTHSGRRDTNTGVSTDKSSSISKKSILNLIKAYHLITFCSFEKTIKSDIISNDQATALSKFNLHLSGLFYILTGIMHKVSFEQNQINKNYPNFIKGRLNSKKYIQQYSNYTYTNFTPCIIKERKYDLIENQLVALSIISALKKLSEIQYSCLKKYPKSDVTQIVNRIYNNLTKFLNNEFFYTSIEKSSQIIRYNDKKLIRKFSDKTKSKFAKNKIRNKYYFALITWIEVFNKFEEEISDLSIDYLLPLSADKNQTVDLLFEFWVLKQIITGLEENSLININKIKPLASRENESYNLNKFICEFSYLGNKYFIYFQHTADICYDEASPPVWKKIDLSNQSTKALGGRPDYSILIQGEDKAYKKTLIIDAKNKPGNKSGTEEVYKIIGYFDNFIGKLGIDATGVLVFRKNKGQGNWINDFDALYEKEHEDKKARIWKIGIDPLGSSEELALQRGKIIKAILNSI